MKPKMPSERMKRQLERLLDDVEEAAQRRDWRLTLRRARTVLTLDSDNEDAREFIAVARQTIAHEPLAGSGADAHGLTEVGADIDPAQLAARLRILNQLMRIAVSSREVSDVFDGIGEQIKRLIDSTRLSVSMHPSGADFVEMYALATGARRVFDKGERLPLRDTAMGEVILTGQPILRVNAPEDYVYPHEFEVAKTIGDCSYLFVPLRSKGRVIGTLNLASRPEAQFSEAELQVAQEIADHLTVVIEHTLLHEELKELGRIEERNRLASEIHNTLANILTGVIIELEGAEANLGEGEASLRDSIQAARRQARDGLAAARCAFWDLQPAELEPGGLPEALRREAARAEDTGLSVSVQVSGQAPDDAEPYCEQILLHVARETLNNVRQHARAAHATIVLEYRSSDTRLQVADDGAGFDPEAAPGLLDAGGFGLGLSRCQERARLAGGYLEVHSAPGAGTEIVAVVPTKPQTTELPVLAQISLTANVAVPAGDRVRVLVVDALEVIRRGIRHMLEQAEGIDVVGEAADGEAALQQVRRLAPDVILLDVQTPKPDAVATLRRLRELRPEARVILLSVFAQDEQIFAGLRAGARGYLVKDVGREDLAQAIRTVHEGGSLLPPIIADRLVSQLDDRARRRLTERERGVLELLAAGSRNKEIAADLALTAGTVKWHIKNIYQKLDATTRTEAVRVARERGLLTS